MKNDCLCGCGKKVKSKFAPGHDQRLATRLLREFLAEHKEAKRVNAAQSQLEQLIQQMRAKGRP